MVFTGSRVLSTHSSPLQPATSQNAKGVKVGSMGIFDIPVVPATGTVSPVSLGSTGPDVPPDTGIFSPVTGSTSKVTGVWDMETDAPVWRRLELPGPAVFAKTRGPVNTNSRTISIWVINRIVFMQNQFPAGAGNIYTITIGLVKSTLFAITLTPF